MHGAARLLSVMHRLLIFFTLVSTISYAQDSTKIKGGAIILGSDTVIVASIDDFEIKTSDWKYRYYLRKVKKLMPYAEHAEELLSEIDESYAQGKRDGNKKVRKVNKNLKDEFAYTVRDMSMSDGEVLCKLIHYKTGKSVHDIISQYGSKTKAALWQGVSRLGGADLKQTYDPKKDVVLERVLKEVESGKIKISDEPVILSKDEFKAEKKEIKARSKRIKKKKKLKKKAERKARKEE